MDLLALDAALHNDYLARMGQRDASARDLLLSALSRDDVVMNDPRLVAIREAALRGEQDASLQQQVRTARTMVARGLWDDVSFENYREPRRQGLFDLLQALRRYEEWLEGS